MQVPTEQANSQDIHRLSAEASTIPSAALPPAPPSERWRASTALHNLRGLTILCLLLMHGSLAYLASAPASSAPFDETPYGWLAFPVLDRSRWLGLDIACAWQDVYLMCIMFFMAGLFTFSSLDRDGPLKFIGRRLMRLGVPMGLGILFLSPLALYPAYLQGASDPSLADYAAKYLSLHMTLPFWPAGPLWFLGALIVMTAIVATLWPGVRPLFVALANFSKQFEAKPRRVFLGWTVVIVGAYTPFALAFTPWRWENIGPFALQLSRLGLYPVYFGAGVAVGAAGLGAGLLNPQGQLSRHWKLWFASAIGSLFLWMGLTGLTLKLGAASPLVLLFVSDASYALAGACSVLFLIGVFLRFGSDRPAPWLSRISNDSFGIYVLHYAPLVWLQYALLEAPLPAPLKALIVIVGTVAICVGVLYVGRTALSALRPRRQPAGA